MTSEIMFSIPYHSLLFLFNFTEFLLGLAAECWMWL